MNSEQRRRLEKIEARLNAAEQSGPPRPGAPMRSVCVWGCLPPGLPLFAVTDNGLEFIRGGEAEDGSDLEDLDLFCDRAAAAARESGASLLTIGGLPQSQAQMDIASRHYKIWSDSDSGVPPISTRAAPMSALQWKMIGGDR